MQQLVVDFGSFDLREQLAFLDMGANVEIPALEIATGSRIDGRITECLGVSGQDYFLRGGTFARKNPGHGGNRGFFCSLFESRLGRCARMDAGVNQESKSSDRGGDKDCDSATVSRASMKSV